MPYPTQEQAEAFQQAAKNAVQDTKRVFVVYQEPDDHWGNWHKSVKKLGPKGLVKTATQGFKDTRQAADDLNKLPDTPQDVVQWAYIALGGEADGMSVSIFTLKEWREQQEEEQRKRCEPLVGEICRKYKVKPNSLEMVKALHKHYKQIIARERQFRDDPEVRAERYAMCAMGGAGRDAFFEDNDYASSKISEATDTLQDALEYLRKYCPLLMARWEEQRKKKK